MTDCRPLQGRQRYTTCRHWHFFVTIVSRDWDDIRKVAPHSLLAVIKEFLKFATACDAGSITSGQVFASAPVRMEPTKVDATNSLPELGDRVRHNADFDLDTLDVGVDCRLWPAVQHLGAQTDIRVASACQREGQCGSDTIKS